MKKKTKWLVFGVVFILCVVSLSFLCYLWFPRWGHMGGSPRYPFVRFNQTISADGWEFTATTVDYIDWNTTTTRDIMYEMWNETAYVDNGTLSSIKNRGSFKYNITWFDKDDDNKLSVGDSLFISKSGGSVGVAEKGWWFALIMPKIPIRFWTNSLDGWGG